MKNLVFLVLLLTLLPACVSANTESLVNDNRCKAPCWYGLVPGKSGMKEVVTTIEALQFIDGKSIEASVNQPVGISWRFTDAASSYGTAIFDTAGLLKLLRIRIIGLQLGGVIDMFGPPESVWVNYQPDDTYVLHLYYPSAGIVVHTSGIPFNYSIGPKQIARDLEVHEIEFFTPTSLTDYLESYELRLQDNIDYILDRLQPWPGFGENVIQIQP